MYIYGIIAKTRSMDYRWGLDILYGNVSRSMDSGHYFDKLKQQHNITDNPVSHFLKQTLTAQNSEIASNNASKILMENPQMQPLD